MSLMQTQNAAHAPGMDRSLRDHTLQREKERLDSIEETLSGPALALFVAVSLSKSLSGKSVDLKFLHTLAANLEYRI